MRVGGAVTTVSTGGQVAVLEAGPGSHGDPPHLTHAGSPRLAGGQLVFVRRAGGDYDMIIIQLCG